MTALALQPFAELFTERLLNTAVEGVALTALSWLFLRFLGRQNSGTRFAVWFSTLVSIAALPFFSSVAPQRLESVSLNLHLHHGVVLSAAWAPYLLAAWGVGAAVLIFRLCVGLWRVHNLRRNCTEVDLLNSDLPALDAKVGANLQDFALGRRVKVCVSSEVAVPAAVGFFRPAIVFPAWLLPQLSPSEIEVIVLHELAHLRRWDDWTNLAQKVIKAVFFFHPAVWWIDSRLMLEREMACDDKVLEQTGSPKAYASSLISFAEKLQSGRALALAQALVSRVHQMSLRVAQILDAKRSRQTGLWKPVVGASLALLALSFGAASYTPKLVAFQSTSSQTPVRQAQTTNTLQPSAAFIPVVARQSEQQRTDAPKARVIQAAFRPKTSVVAAKSKTALPHKPMIVLTKTVHPEIPVQETIFILRTTILRTTGYDDFGAPASRIWTLCIWTMDGKSVAQSTVVTGSI